MYQDINIHLPDDTLVEIDRLSPQGDRLLFIIFALLITIDRTHPTSLVAIDRG